MEKIIDTILEKEKQAEKIIEASKINALEIIQDSRNKAEQVIKESRERAAKKGKILMEEAASSGSKEAGKLLKESEELIEQIQNLSGKNIQKALDFIFRKIK